MYTYTDTFTPFHIYMHIHKCIHMHILYSLNSLLLKSIVIEC